MVAEFGAGDVLISSGLNHPGSVALDDAWNVYIGDTNNNAVKEWAASTHQLTTIDAASLTPTGIAVDVVGKSTSRILSRTRSGNIFPASWTGS